ncbi:efflux RND transporter periplasmic adaptor subunit [Geitlerinema splendidum]|jgi:membrane fusion protein (multidrug efflux system)|nr:efflux RND transporter periplasmic adaptor subunit [Geitlerinema splendidum]
MKTYKKIIIALVICGLGLGAILWLKKGKEVAEIVLKEPTPVEAVRAKSGPILRRINTVGSLSAIQSVTLRPQVNGKIEKIYFQGGARVKAGDPLFKIEDGIYKAKVAEAEAHLMVNRETYNRAIKLLEKNFGTPQERDKTYAEMMVAQAHLDEAKIQLENTLIKAPFEGVIGLSEVSVGALVSESVELANLVDLDPINVDFSIPESYLPFVHEGDIVDVTIEDFDILPIEATIKAIAPEIEESTRTITIRAEMPNANLSYRPGEFARVLVLAGKIENAILIPATAIERESGGEEEYVMLVVDNVAVRSTVSTGMKDGNDVEITHGVKANDLVVSAGQFKLRDGDEVNVVNLEEAASESK